MEQFNKNNIAIINSIGYNVCSLKEDGSLGLITNERKVNSEIKCDENFDISWDLNSFD